MKKGDKIKVKDKGVLLDAVVVEVGTRVLECIDSNGKTHYLSI